MRSDRIDVLVLSANPVCLAPGSILVWIGWVIPALRSLSLRTKGIRLVTAALPWARISLALAGWQGMRGDFLVASTKTLACPLALVPGPVTGPVSPIAGR